MYTESALIIVGDELLSGRTRDVNLFRFSRLLGDYGIPLVTARVVRDIPSEISASVSELMSRGRLLIVSGGMGPTDDDLTVAAVAEALGLPLERNPDAEEMVRKKLNDGWIKSWMMIEAMAVNEEAINSALKKHVDAMEKEDQIIVIKKDFKENKKVIKPFKGIEEAYSGVVELEILTGTFDKLFYIVINYGPSAMEILEPERITLDMGEAQGVLNSMADIIHRFAGRMGGMTMDT